MKRLFACLFISFSIINYYNQQNFYMIALCEQAEFEYLDAVAAERQSREREPHKSMEWEAKYLKIDED